MVCNTLRSWKTSSFVKRTTSKNYIQNPRCHQEEVEDRRLAQEKTDAFLVRYFRGTEPLARVMVEGEDYQTIRGYVDEIVPIPSCSQLG